MKMGAAGCRSRRKLVCVSSGEIRLRAWELAVEKAEVEVATSTERVGVWLCKAAAAVESESRGLRWTNHVHKVTMHHCPM